MSEDRPGRASRIFNSLEKALVLPNVTEKEIFGFYYQEEQIGSIKFHQIEDDTFPPLYYSNSFDSADLAARRTIPASDSRYSVHFLPPEIEKFRKKEIDGEKWHQNKAFRALNGQIKLKYLHLMVEFLKVVKSGQFKMDFVTSETNGVMADFAAGLGFKRCWEIDQNPPDLTRGVDEDKDVLVGTSIKDLIEFYDLDNQDPSLEMVNQKVREQATSRSAVRELINAKR